MYCSVGVQYRHNRIGYLLNPRVTNKQPPFRADLCTTLHIREEDVAAYLALLRSSAVSRFLARDYCYMHADK